MRRAVRACLLAFSLSVIACKIALSAPIVDAGNAGRIEDIQQFLEKLPDGPRKFSVQLDKVDDPINHDKQLSVLRIGFDGGPTFDTGQDNIRVEFFPLLEALAVSLRDENPKALVIVGHTDSRGSEKYNIDLSLRRALSVANELKKLGVGTTSITVAGLGKFSPLRPNDSPENMSYNRRIEFLIATDGNLILPLLSKSRSCPASYKGCSHAAIPVRIVANVDDYRKSDIKLDIGTAINQFSAGHQQVPIDANALKELATIIGREIADLQRRRLALEPDISAENSWDHGAHQYYIGRNERRLLERSLLELQVRELELERLARTIEQKKLPLRPPTHGSSQSGPSPQNPSLEVFFPWPPPPASARTTMPAATFHDRARFQSIGRVADFLETALRQGGFDDWSYFSLPDEDASFGLVSHMEQIEPANGQPLSDRSRWADRAYAAATMSFLGSLLTIKRPVGHYRAFVFILSTVPTPEKTATDSKPDELATLALARQWAARGKRYLPIEIRSLPMSDQHRLTVRIYEFEQPDKGNSELVKNSLDSHAAS